MAESAYHNEALRRQRVIERKKDAERRLLHGTQYNDVQGNGDYATNDTVLYSGPGHFEQNREDKKSFEMAPMKNPGRKPVMKTPKPLPASIRNIERDSVYKILHPSVNVETMHRIYHRKANNNPEDKVSPLLHPKEILPNRKQLPPRKPHLKV